MAKKRACLFKEEEEELAKRAKGSNEKACSILYQPMLTIATQEAIQLLDLIGKNNRK